MNTKEFLNYLKNKNILCIDKKEKQDVCNKLEELELVCSMSKQSNIDNNNFICIHIGFGNNRCYCITEILHKNNKRLDYKDFIIEYSKIEEPKISKRELLINAIYHCLNIFSTKNLKIISSMLCNFEEYKEYLMDKEDENQGFYKQEAYKKRK